MSDEINNQVIDKQAFLSPTGWLTKSLILDAYPEDPSSIMFTTKPHDQKMEDGRVARSLYLLYMSCSDPTEYEFATKYLGGWAHWLKLQKNTQVAAKLKSWREEFSVRATALAISNIIDNANDPEKNNYQANKFLVDKGWIEKPKAGRPTELRNAQNKKEVDKVKSILKADITKLADYKKANG